MDLYSAPMGIDAYIAKFIDENGCTFKEACEALDIDEQELMSFKYDNEGMF
ncbi:MAG: hypothetical protein ACRC7N_20470 [Clostridium sp.]